MRNKRIFLFILFFLLSLGLTAKEPINAQGLAQVGFQSQPMFKYENLAPGYCQSSFFSVENLTESDVEHYIWIENLSSKKNLAKNIDVGLSRADKVFFKHSLEYFFEQGLVYVESIKSLAEKEYNLVFCLDKSVGNNFQNKEIVFDLKIGFKEGGKQKEEFNQVQTIVAGSFSGGSSSPQSLKISDIEVGEIDSNKALISWKTNKFVESKLVYSLFKNGCFFDVNDKNNFGYKNVLLDNKLKTYHDVYLTSLEEDSKYCFRVVAEKNKLTTSEEKYFKTLVSGDKDVESQKKKNKDKDERKSQEGTLENDGDFMQRGGEVAGAQDNNLSNDGLGREEGMGGVQSDKNKKQESNDNKKNNFLQTNGENANINNKDGIVAGIVSGGSKCINWPWWAIVIAIVILFALLVLYYFLLMPKLKKIWWIVPLLVLCLIIIFLFRYGTC